jgi:uncharacterized oligopeptide transporter (OPT) family protein
MMTDLEKFKYAVAGGVLGLLAIALDAMTLAWASKLSVAHIVIAWGLGSFTALMLPVIIAATVTWVILVTDGKVNTFNDHRNDEYL